jgi:hypothetical protein
VFLQLIVKRGDQFLRQQINIKFCVKLGKNASDTCAVLSSTSGGEAMKKSSVLSGINASKRACLLKSNPYHFFFHMKVYYMEILKLLCDLCLEKGLDLAQQLDFLP